MTSKHIQKQAYCMGTSIDLQIVSTQPTVDIENLLETGINIFQQIKARYSRFETQSELSRLNSSKTFFVCQDLEIIQLIKFGIDLYKKTDGIFDISIADFLNIYGYSSKSNAKIKILGNEINQLLKTRPKLIDIKINEEKLEILLQPNQKLDLGSYVKGFAIKKVKEFFLESEIKNFLINAGGDIYANGTNKNQEPWIIGLFDTNKKNISKRTTLQNESIACSGKWARKFQTFNHLINPLTGKCIETEDVFVKSKDPMIADAFATICYLNSTFSSLSKEYDFKILE